LLLLVVLSALPGFALGADSWPDLSILLPVLGGMLLLGCSCSALNGVIERDRDALMERTRDRPLVTGVLSPAEVTAFGVITGLGSVALLWWGGGWPAAALGAGTEAFYLVVYTVWLKPRTHWNTVLGASVGAAAPLIADIAPDGRIGVGGWLLFALVFAWTPPHFGAISLYRKEEYGAAGFKMMANVLGDDPTRRRTLPWTFLTLAISLAPVPLGLVHPAYAAPAGLLGAWFLGAHIRQIRVATTEMDRAMFRVSVRYMGAIILAMLIAMPWAPAG